MNKKALRILSFLLVFSLSLAPVALAADSAFNTIQASDYLNAYNARISSTGSGGVKVSFDVSGTGKMDEIGATSIYLYESTGSGWSLVKTFTYKQPAYTYIMGYNTSTHSASVTYSGTSGAQYYALVYFWAGKGGNGDSASKTTTAVIA